MKTKKVNLAVDWTQDAWAPKITFARFAMPVPRLSPLPLSPVNHRCYSPPQTTLFTTRGSRGFTLIEMLVVIAVIAILAGIIIGVLPAAKNKSIRSSVKAEMNAVETAINSYKAKHNFFPPDNSTANGHATPPLYYELTGTTNDTAKFWAPGAPNELDRAEIKSIFGIDGFLNTSVADDESAAQNFYKTLLPRQARDFPVTPNSPRIYKLLVAPRHGLDKQPAVWHYNKSNPTNNVGEYDLWAEIDIGGEKVVIGNWEK